MLSPTCAISLSPSGPTRPLLLILLPRTGWLDRLFDRIERPTDAPDTGPTWRRQ